MLSKSYCIFKGTYNLIGISPSNSKIYFLGIIPGSVKLVSNKKMTDAIKNNVLKTGITELLLI